MYNFAYLAMEITTKCRISDLYTSPAVPHCLVKKQTEIVKHGADPFAIYRPRTQGLDLIFVTTESQRRAPVISIMKSVIHDMTSIPDVPCAFIIIGVATVRNIDHIPVAILSISRAY